MIPHIFSKRVRFFSKAIIMVLFFSMTGFSNAAENVRDEDFLFGFAGEAYQQGAYDIAATEFERFVFYYPDDPRAPEAKFNAGMSYFNRGRFERAIETFEALVRRFEDSPYAIEALFMAAESDRRRNNHASALFRLGMLTRETVDTEIRDRALYSIGWIMLEQREHAPARRALAEISPARREAYQVDELLNRLDQMRELPVKSPTLAGILGILPGGGYLYTGRYRDAWISFAFTTVFAGAAYESFDNHLYLPGSILAFIAAGFYSGSIYGSIGAAHKFNRDTYNNFVDELRREHPDPPIGRPFLGMQFREKGAALTFNFRF